MDTRCVGARMNPAEAISQGRRVTPSRRRRVLIVDDSRTFLHAVVEELRKDGHDLFTAYSGEEALALLKSQPVDCILMDLALPGMDGIAAARLIRADPKMAIVPVLMFTAHLESQRMSEALTVGVDAFCPKASDLGLLRVQVRNLLRRRATDPELPAITLPHPPARPKPTAATLFEQVVERSGLSPVLASATLARVCQYANVAAETLDEEKLVRVLPYIRDALRVFLTEHETRRRMVDIEELTRGARRMVSLGGH
jgi:CheY-like chemotaxis protein